MRLLLRASVVLLIGGAALAGAADLAASPAPDAIGVITTVAGGGR